MAQIVEATGTSRFAGAQPGFPRLAALPCARGEAEDLDFDATALQRARQNIGAGRCHCDRAPAHRARIVEEKGYHGIAEIHLLFVLERERMQRVDHDAGKPRGIEQTLFQIELPRAILLRHQTTLQPIRESRHHPLQMRKLLVQIAAQTIELLRLA